VTSTLHCPNCGKDLGLRDHSEAAPHQFARRLKALVFPVTFVWTMLILAGLIPFAFLSETGGFDWTLGWLVFSLPAIPGFLLSVLSWFFPKVRIWTCGKCGHVHEVRLKARHIDMPEHPDAGAPKDSRSRISTAGTRKKSPHNPGYDKNSRGGQAKGGNYKKR